MRYKDIVSKIRSPGMIVKVDGFILLVASFFLAWNNTAANIWMAVMSIGIAVIALGISMESDARMRVLTALNFNEKMAMMANYKKAIAGIDTEKPSERLDDLGSVLDSCNYDLRAISHLRNFVTHKEKKKLIEEYVIDIINSAQSKDTCKNNRKIICELIKNALEIDPENKELK